MKLTLTFDLNDEDTLQDVLTALYGPSYLNAITETDNWLRGLVKYEGKTFIEVEAVRKHLREETEGLPDW